MTDWMPGAEVVVGAHSGGTLVGGPPRCTWHITWCHLDPRPTFDNVRDYLMRENFEPTLMWDPEDGRVAQFLPASRSAYAVRNLPGGVETNRYGDVHVQIEVYFSPGYKGRALFTDGPLVGLDKIMAWLDGLGIPRVAAGDWANPDRDVNRWLTQPGHYGHFEVPENNHEDPIKGTDIALILATGAPPTPHPPEDEVRTATYVTNADAPDPKPVYLLFDTGEFVGVRDFDDAEEIFVDTLGVKIVNYTTTSPVGDSRGHERPVWHVGSTDPAGHARGIVFPA